MFHGIKTIHTRMEPDAKRRGVCSHAAFADGGNMRDLCLQLSGGLALVVSLIHAVLGETKVIATAKIEPPRMRALLRGVWHAGAIAWAGFAVLLLLAPALSSTDARHAIIVAAIIVYLAGAIANAWALNGRHPGWLALTAVSVLAAAGW